MSVWGLSWREYFYIVSIVAAGALFGIFAHEAFHALGGVQAICLGQTTNPSLAMPLGSFAFVQPAMSFNSFFGNELIAFVLMLVVVVVWVGIGLKAKFK